MTDADKVNALEARMHVMEQKWKLLSVEVLHLKESMDANTIALKEYIEISKQLKVGMKFLGYIEAAMVFVAKVGAGFATVWALWRFVILEAIEQAGKK